ncbi:unnamed protein product, partial [Anisakis simplex]|uniref:Rab-GAP TBC domain-containing protein n=1 Tax=Anisakis simplex TaxID=6269 RepID=A0A0M3KJ92_ANISI
MYRMFILSRLLAAYPFRERLLLHECGADVPPLYRAHLWAAFLNVSPANATDRFRKFDTHDEHPSDRQLMVDIPRCHQ